MGPLNPLHVNEILWLVGEGGQCRTIVEVKHRGPKLECVGALSMMSESGHMHCKVP